MTSKKTTVPIRRFDTLLANFANLEKSNETGWREMEYWRTRALKAEGAVERLSEVLTAAVKR